ncbi:HAD family hydrolase, partial [Streptomyces sp. NPDC055078]
PEVSGAEGVFGCGGWTASVREGELVLEGDGPAMDGLRALCGAAWTDAGAGVCGRDAGKALARLGL